MNIERALGVLRGFAHVFVNATIFRAVWSMPIALVLVLGAIVAALLMYTA